MLETIKYWWTIRGLQKRKAVTIKAFAKQIKTARKTNVDKGKVGEMRQQEHYEMVMLDDEIGIAVTRRLTRQAAQLLIPVPYGEDDWEESAPFGSRFLTRGGATKLRADIRAEKKARWDWWQSRISMIGSVVGIVGGLMGALAYFKPPLPPHP